MKHLYFLIAFLISSIGFTQNDLLGEWYLHYINIDGNQQYTTVQDSNNTIFFENNSFYGSVCSNGHAGGYSLNTDNTISITSFVALTGGCDYDIEISLFLHPYLWEFINYSIINPIFDYSISGSGSNEMLTLTNANNDFAVYSRSPLVSSELLGEWYLSKIKVDDVVYPNYYNNESEFELEFSQSSGNNNDFDLLGLGVCDSFDGTVTPNGNSITFNEMNFTLLEPCSNTPGFVFEEIYFSIFENPSVPFDFDYSVDHGYFEQTLTISNPFTGDEATYGRFANTESLSITWYLSRIEIPGNPNIQIPLTESPSLSITNEINQITSKTLASGIGECNEFFSDYEISLNNSNSIQLIDFTPTLAICDSDYESEYFNTIGYLSSNFSEFEIINNGSTLILTDLLGAKLIFGDQPLSISENNFNTLNISLKNNPVSDKIDLIHNSYNSRLNYQIYSIDGKLIKQASIQSESINIGYLNSGLYFIRFSNDSKQIQTIKFIKQ